MRIKKVTIKGFQSHIDTQVELDKDFNVFVGSSNSGKSSVLRAINWCLTNAPSGTDYINKSVGKALVRLDLDNGYSIERSRNRSSDNYYRVYDEEGNLINEYTGFSTGVPKEVELIVGTKEEIEYTSANQMEAPYLISDTPRVRAEKIGNLEEFAKLDLAMTDIKEDERGLKKERREIISELENIKNEVKELEKELEDDVRPMFELLDDITSLVIEKNEKLRKMTDVRRKTSEVSFKVDKYQEEYNSSKMKIDVYEQTNLENKVNTFNSLTKKTNELKKCKSELDDIKNRNFLDVEELEVIVGSIERKIDTFKELTKVKNSLKTVDDKRKSIPKYNELAIGIDLTSIETKIERFKNLTVLKNSILESKMKRKENEKVISQTYVRIEELLNKFLKELQEKEKCPTCLQDTTKVDKELIIKNL